jgi:hypothetical protein
MLEQTARNELQEKQETGIGKIIRTFDLDVPGYVFWPVIFGVGGNLRASGAPRLLSVRSCRRCLTIGQTMRGTAQLGLLPCAAILRQRWHRICQFRHCHSAMRPGKRVVLLGARSDGSEFLLAQWPVVRVYSSIADRRSAFGAEPENIRSF